MTVRKGWIGALLVFALAVALPARPSAQVLIRDAEIERTLDRMTAPIFTAAGIAPSSVEIYVCSTATLTPSSPAGGTSF